MKFFVFPERLGRRPEIQMAPLIDIMFITLVFFMTISVLYQMESELSISVPKAEEAKDKPRAPGEIIINIHRDGSVIVNQRKLDFVQLKKMLGEISSLFPNQPVIVRADEMTYHKHVIKVLDACASANIWNVAFSAIKLKEQ